MSERVEFEMTDAERESLMEACRSVPYMVFGGVEPSSPQENANRFWRRLADEHGFVWDTVRPVTGKPDRFFSAELRAGVSL